MDKEKITLDSIKKMGELKHFANKLANFLDNYQENNSISGDSFLIVMSLASEKVAVAMIKHHDESADKTGVTCDCPIRHLAGSLVELMEKEGPPKKS